uniref:DUF3995 domain-containing protein n=1 Tax=Steinernema glaseri TaxID=37863 RepID=A0A1I7Z0S2_9BILA
MDFMDRGRETGRVLVSSFIFTGCLSVFHDSLSIGIFLERVYCILCPFRAIHWRVKIVVGGVVLFLTTVGSVATFWASISTLETIGGIRPGIKLSFLWWLFLCMESVSLALALCLNSKNSPNGIP